jgi:membrane associated rhomboid family serine protease
MPAKSPLELVQVSRHLRQDQADERGLVLLALGFANWIFSEDGVYGLYVDARHAEAATVELERFESERAAELDQQREAMQHPAVPSPNDKTGPFSLFVFTWAMCLFFAIQSYQSPRWTDLGAANSDAILRGELWRTVTALTLHADAGHLFANIATGLIFAWALLPLLGSGWTWIGFVLSGIAGNGLNAALHQGGSHISIGASTAVFGGLGLLVGWQTIEAVFPAPGLTKRPRRWRETLLPLAAGFALLAYLGVGNGTDNVDIMAHGLGLLSGILIGGLLAWTRLPERTPPTLQKILAAAACALPALAWVWAMG